MSLKQLLDTRQSLVMTQDLQESVKILQYSNIDLISYINQQLETNPFLSFSENEEDDSFEEDVDHELDNDINDYNFEDYVSSAIYEENTNFSKSEKLAGNFGDNFDNQEKTISLREHIYEQINIDIHTNRDKIIASYLLDMLDDNGYLDLNYEYIIRTIKCSKEEIDLVLGMLQNFNPPGIFARSLAECLCLQLKDRNLYNENLACVLEHLNLVAGANFVQIQKKCNVNIEQLKEYIALIKSLNPKSLLDREERSSDSSDSMKKCSKVSKKCAKNVKNRHFTVFSQLNLFK